MEGFEFERNDRHWENEAILGNSYKRKDSLTKGRIIVLICTVVFAIVIARVLHSRKGRGFFYLGMSDITEVEINLHAKVISEPEPVKIRIPFSYLYLLDKIKIITLPDKSEWVHIEDESPQQCGATIGVSIGSFGEHNENLYPGIAHLLEHSVFLKETKALKSKILDWNAFTADDKTDYMFSSSIRDFSSVFEQKWKELVSFSPTPKIKDEVSAVNSE